MANDSRENVVATTDVNTPMVHDSEAIAYERPKRNMDQRPRSWPPLSRRGRATSGSQPTSHAMPAATRATPITTVSYGDHLPTANDVHDTSAPATANSTRKPADTTAP